MPGRSLARRPSQTPPAAAGFALVWSLLGCAPTPPGQASALREDPVEASGSRARWNYEIAVDEAIETMDLSLCIEGPRPLRVKTMGEGARFVRHARVRGGPALAREGQSFMVETLGEHGCLEFEVDLDAALSAGGRDSIRRGDTALISPDRWLWFPAEVPDQVEARARFVLPEGVHATTPWPALADGWRALDHSVFGWNAWIVLGQHTPIEFEIGQTSFEVAVLDGSRAATDPGIEAWIRASAASSVALYGAFPRERVSVAVVPSSSWGSSPVLFGMARRGGGGSIMLLLADDADDSDLPGEWVATHELLHLGMPLVDSPWMSEGFVTYYTDVLRARIGVLTQGDADAQTARALAKLADGFDRGHSGLRTLRYASDNMRRFGSYGQVYWGGAALAFDLDVSIRHATGNRHGLDDMMWSMVAFAPRHRSFRAADLVAHMDERVQTWRAAGELEGELSIADIVERHLSAKSVPQSVESLASLAVTRDGDRVELHQAPQLDAAIRSAMFAPAR